MKKRRLAQVNKVHLSYRAVLGTYYSTAIYALNTPKAYNCHLVFIFYYFLCSMGRRKQLCCLIFFKVIGSRQLKNMSSRLLEQFDFRYFHCKCVLLWSFLVRIFLAFKFKLFFWRNYLHHIYTVTFLYKSTTLFQIQFNTDTS